MTITASDAVYPNNVVKAVYDRTLSLLTDVPVFRRPLRRTDPNQCVGVFAATWFPEVDSYELLGHSPGEPTIQNYSIGVQAVVKDTNEENGLAVHSVLSQLLRLMLYRDDTLKVALSTLSVSAFGSTEYMKRWDVRSQSFMSNELDGQFTFISSLEFVVQTEVTS